MLLTSVLSTDLSLHVHFRRAWHWLTAPLPTIADSEVRLKSQVLAGLFVIAIPLGVLLASLSPLLNGQSVLKDLDVFWAVIGVILAVFPYILARLGFYQRAILLTDLIAVFVIMALTVMDSNTEDVRYLMLMMLLASAFLHDRSIVILIAINLLAILSIAFFDPQMTLQGIVLSEVIFFLFGFAAVLLIVWLRDVLELQRTKELKAVNLALQAEIAARQQAEQRNLELALERERLSMLEHFVTDIAHDFRTPLTTMKLNVYLLKQKQGDARALDNYASVLVAQIDHLNQSLEDMLLILRLESDPNYLSLHLLAVNDLVQSAVRPHAEFMARKELTFSFLSAEVLPPVQADLKLLTQTIDILLMNAIFYTPAGGTITLRTAYADPWVVIEVADTGIGITPEDLPNVFDRFFRGDSARSTHTGKVGLGLSIAQKIVQAHQGQITVESVPEQGSVFRVMLPCDQ